MLGVLQLLNAKDKNKIISYNKDIVHLVESLASQASIALTNQLLIEEQKELFKCCKTRDSHIQKDISW